MKRTLATILVSFAAGAGVAQATGVLSPDAPKVVPPAESAAAPAPIPELDGFSPARSLAPLVKQLQPAVVNIQVKQKVAHRSMPMSPFFSPFFGGQMPQGETQYRVRTGQGSGFLISEDGYLLTNHHVVAHADEVTVKLADDREYIGTVVGKDSRIDIALVKIEAKEALPYVGLGKSDGMEVGDWVVAIGNPFGLSHTVTAGIVSAKGRVIGAGPYDDFIQTDASINPGNSGGPLFNLKGEVIGINTAINAAGQGIGFAVPSDMFSPFLDDLKTEGRISRGWLGIGLQNMDEALAESLGVDAGVLVSEVYQDQPAADAGLKSGDVITGLGDDAIDSNTALIRLIGKRPAGEKVALKIHRDGETKTLRVTLGERPGEQELRQASYQPKPGRRNGRPGAAKLGFTIGVDDDTPGVLVRTVKQGHPAHGRLQKMDRILKLNGQQVDSRNELEAAMRKSKEHAIFVVKRGGSTVWVAVPRR
jgi:serine protease Do